MGGEAGFSLKLDREVENHPRVTLRGPNSGWKNERIFL
jgi:hypothetical protein